MTAEEHIETCLRGLLEACIKGCSSDLISQDVGDESVDELLFGLLRVLFGELGDVLQGGTEL